MPSIIWAWPPFPKSLRICGSEPGHPTTNRLITYVEPSLRQQIFDITQAEIDPKIEPDNMLDHRQRELETGVRNRAHHSIIASDRANRYSCDNTS